MSLIDKEYFIGAMEESKRIHGEYSVSINNFINSLKSAPTVDAEPVRHGHWEIHTDAVGNTYYECSCCHTTWWEIKSNDNYCSACGAKMDEEATDERV